MCKIHRILTSKLYFINFHDITTETVSKHYMQLHSEKNDDLDINISLKTFNKKNITFGLSCFGSWMRVCVTNYNCFHCFNTCVAHDFRER